MKCQFLFCFSTSSSQKQRKGEEQQQNNWESHSFKNKNKNKKMSKGYLEKCQFLFTGSSSRTTATGGGTTTTTAAAATTPATSTVAVLASSSSSAASSAATVPSSSSRLYRCSTCLLIFPCNDALNLHLTSHHLHPQNLNLNEIKAKDTCIDEVNDENVFKCSICDKVYESKVGCIGFRLDIYH